MKKHITFVVSLALLFLVGCNQNQTSSTDTSSSTTSSNVTTSVETSTSIPVKESLVAHYDFSTISGKFDKNNEHSLDFEEEMLPYFTNTIDHPVVTLKSVTHSERGVHKSVLSEGPKVGGIRLKSQVSTVPIDNYNGQIHLELEEDDTIDIVELEIRSWNNEKFAIQFNDNQGKIYNGNMSETIKIRFKNIDMNSLDIKCVRIGDMKSRFTITGLNFYNEL